mmetsp:Transcript_23603/g.70769  ORF Transcript_23603/g.70769 Transcript_23603/m.70769 type:complete len:371 (+) Transcript_23603:1661-2773(+)
MAAISSPSSFSTTSVAFFLASILVSSSRQIGANMRIMTRRSSNLRVALAINAAQPLTSASINAKAASSSMDSKAACSFLHNSAYSALVHSVRTLTSSKPIIFLILRIQTPSSLSERYENSFGIMRSNSSTPEPGTGAFIKYHLMCLPDLGSSRVTRLIHRTIQCLLMGYTAILATSAPVRASTPSAMVILKYKGFANDGTPWIPSSSTSSSSSEEPSDSSGATSAGVSGRLFTRDGAGPGAAASCCWAYSSNRAYCFRPLCFLLFFLSIFRRPPKPFLRTVMPSRTLSLIGECSGLRLWRCFFLRRCFLRLTGLPLPSLPSERRSPILPPWPSGAPSSNSSAASLRRRVGLASKLPRRCGLSAASKLPLL